MLIGRDGNFQLQLAFFPLSQELQHVAALQHAPSNASKTDLHSSAHDFCSSSLNADQKTPFSDKMQPLSSTTSTSLFNDTTAEDSLNPPPPGLGMLVRDCVSVEHGMHVVIASLVKGTMCVCVCVCVCV